MEDHAHLDDTRLDGQLPDASAKLSGEVLECRVGEVVMVLGREKCLLAMEWPLQIIVELLRRTKGD